MDTIEIIFIETVWTIDKCNGIEYQSTVKNGLSGKKVAYTFDRHLQNLRLLDPIKTQFCHIFFNFYRSIFITNALNINVVYYEWCYKVNDSTNATLWFPMGNDIECLLQFMNTEIPIKASCRWHGDHR